MFSIKPSDPVSDTESGQNLHIKSFLSHYLSLEHSPYYAVLISGAWGIGKTYLVKSILKDLLIDTPYSYISLYGLDSVDAIDSALYQSLHPLLSSKSVKFAGRAGKALMKYVKADDLISIKDFVNLGNNRLFVFDDLERSPLKPDVLLGYINEMVEHDGYKVLIIGNEEKLLDKEGYKETREKLIGRTLEVQPEVHGALSYFIAQLNSEKTKEALCTNLETITTIFSEASATNFRVMQQTIWDFERIIENLDQKHLDHPLGIKTLTETFFAISLEVKAGALTKADILERPDSLMRAMMRVRQGDPELPIDIANNRFSEADLYNSILSAEFISELLFKGLVSKSLLWESLDRSTHYVDVSTEPAWRTVWHGFERSEEQFLTALAEMERQFLAREIIDPGVILHIVGLRVWLSEVGELKLNRTEAFQQAKEYINDLYETQKLTPMEHDNFGGRNYEGHGGLGIHEQGSEDFSDFVKFMEHMQSKSAIDQYPEKAKKLLEDMRLDASVFLRKVCPTNDSDNIYAYIPLLASIPPKDFASTVMNLDGASKRRVIMALSMRYSHGNLQRYLAEETTWLFDLDKEFNAVLKSLRPIDRWSFSSALNHYIEPIIIQAGGRN